MNELKGISINKLIEYLSTNTLAEFNAYTRPPAKVLFSYLMIA
ncbi:hypothetical protein MAESPC_04308 [Microcystis aeruginosa SPC777]|uniref:Uncharacterized protein n=1 Tax=Microcystis aeruginosa SPC777 TaxID=482300 RepID=S3J2H8_MICAE|nr:hypothetical protein MAESPC_04308 [Microcystis aeruginosa SPC777]